MHADTTAADAVHKEGGGVDSLAVQQEALITVPVEAKHRVDKFSCKNSPRVAGFFAGEAKVLVPNYCRLFIATPPDDEATVWGYYTLSAALLFKQNLSGGDEKKISKQYMGIPAPMVRIGFMGRDDNSPKGFGAALLIDAARRVHRNGDIAAWGLVLESDGGPENKKLWDWYQAQGFKLCRGAHPHSMYGPLSAFLPELQP
jgi:GNAT superfamily N-acetyltransferase